MGKGRRLTVGYIRVSTGSNEQRTSREGQRFVLEEAGCDLILEDVVSGSSGAPRRDWLRLNSMVARGEVGLVRFVDTARLARDGSDLDFLKLCRAADTAVVDVLTGKLWEIETVDGLLTAGMMSVMNQVQSLQISVKVRDGLARRRRAGCLARGAVPFGYLHRDGEAVKHPENWRHARELVELLLHHQMAWYRVLANLPPDFPWRPTPTGLKGWWRNPMLRGGVGYNAPRGTQHYEEIEWGKAPQLITPQEWRHGQRLAEQRSKGRALGGKGIDHLFTGLVRCSLCGKNLHWHTKRNAAPRYACKYPACSRFTSIREEVLRREVAVKLAQKAQAMVEALQREIEIGAMPLNAEQLELEHQLEVLENLAAQGVQGLNQAMCRLRDRILEFTPAAPIITAADSDLMWEALQEPENFEQLDDRSLRRLIIEYIELIEFQGDPEAVHIVLRR